MTLRLTRPILALVLPLVAAAGPACSGGGPSGPIGAAPPTGPTVGVSTTDVSFPADAGQRSLVLLNLGASPVEWRVVAIDVPWVSLDPASGTLLPGETTVTIRVDRSGLVPGTHRGEVRLLLGPREFAVAVEVLHEGTPIPVLEPEVVELGPDDASAALRLANDGDGPLGWSLRGPTWLDLEATAGTLAAGGETEIDVVPRREGLPEGVHAGTIELASNGGGATVEVRVAVLGPPVLAVSPATTLDFGVQATRLSLTLIDDGSRPLEWTGSANAPWISLSPSSGVVEPHASRTVTVEVQRAGLAVGGHEGAIRLSSNGGDATVRVLLTVPEIEPPRLDVSPSTLDFGETGTSLALTVANGGEETLAWTAAADDGWISLSPATGDAPPGSSRTVTVGADRAGLAVGDYASAIRLSSNGGDATVAIALTVPASPSSVALEGVVVDQFSGSGLPGLSVTYAGETVTTDGQGRFAVSGEPSGSLLALTLSGSAIHRRETFARDGDDLWLAIPRSFDMNGFDDMARDYEPWTIRWVASPQIYFDVTPPAGYPPGSELDDWIVEVRGMLQAFVEEWSHGEVPAGGVTEGTSPPVAGSSSGWIVIGFSEDDGLYGSANTVGLATTYWNADQSIHSARIWLRFSKVSGAGNAGARQAVVGHEIGHAMGVGHMDGATASLMTPSISRIDLSRFDVSVAHVLYTRSPGNSSPDTDAIAYFRGALVPSGGPAGFRRWVCDPPEPTPIEGASGR